MRPRGQGPRNQRRSRRHRPPPTAQLQLKSVWPGGSADFMLAITKMWNVENGDEKKERECELVKDNVFLFPTNKMQFAECNLHFTVVNLVFDDRLGQNANAVANESDCFAVKSVLSPSL